MSKETGTPAGKQLSDGLKARLKRCGRYHSSPSAPSSNISKHADLAASFSEARESKYSSCDKTVSTNSLETLSRVTGDQSVAKNDNLSKPEPISFRSQVKVGRFEDCTKNSTACNQDSDVSKKGVSLSDHENQVHTAISPSVENIEKGKQDYNTPNASRCRSKGPFSRTGKLTFANIEQEISKDKLEKDTGIEDFVLNVDKIEEKHLPSDTPVSVLIRQKTQLEILLHDKEETLRKLNMVKMYRTKNDLDHLTSLTKKWRDGSQQALVDLQQLMPEPKPTLTELINHHQIDHTMIGYNTEDENFTD